MARGWLACLVLALVVLLLQHGNAHQPDEEEVFSEVADDEDEDHAISEAFGDPSTVSGYEAASDGRPTTTGADADSLDGSSPDYDHEDADDEDEEGSSGAGSSAGPNALPPSGRTPPPAAATRGGEPDEGESMAATAAAIFDSLPKELLRPGGGGGGGGERPATIVAAAEAAAAAAASGGGQLDTVVAAAAAAAATAAAAAATAAAARPASAAASTTAQGRSGTAQGLSSPAAPASGRKPYQADVIAVSGTANGDADAGSSSAVADPTPSGVIAASTDPGDSCIIGPAVAAAEAAAEVYRADASAADFELPTWSDMGRDVRKRGEPATSGVYGEVATAPADAVVASLMRALGAVTRRSPGGVNPLVALRRLYVHRGGRATSQERLLSTKVGTQAVFRIAAAAAAGDGDGKGGGEAARKDEQSKAKRENKTKNKNKNKNKNKKKNKKFTKKRGAGAAGGNEVLVCDVMGNSMRWVVHFDKASQQNYYYNAEQDETQWAVPCEDGGEEEEDLEVGEEDENDENDEDDEEEGSGGDEAEPMPEDGSEQAAQAQQQQQQQQQHGFEPLFDEGADLWSAGPLRDAVFGFKGEFDHLSGMARLRTLPLDMERTAAELAGYAERFGGVAQYERSLANLEAIIKAAEQVAATGMGGRGSDGEGSTLAQLKALWESSVTHAAADREINPMTTTLGNDERTQLATIAFAAGSAWADLGAMWFVSGKVGRSVECYRRALHWDAGNMAAHAGVISMLQQMELQEESCHLLLKLMFLRGPLGIARMWMNMPPGERSDAWRTQLVRVCTAKAKRDRHIGKYGGFLGLWSYYFQERVGALYACFHRFSEVLGRTGGFSNVLVLLATAWLGGTCKFMDAWTPKQLFKAFVGGAPPRRGAGRAAARALKKKKR